MTFVSIRVHWWLLAPRSPALTFHVCLLQSQRLALERMSTLAEIERAADALPSEEKQELILFLAARLRRSGVKLPPPRKFSREQIAGWIAADEAEMQRFRQGV